MSDFDFRRVLLVVCSAPILAGIIAPGDARQQVGIMVVYICAMFALLPWERRR